MSKLVIEFTIEHKNQWPCRPHEVVQGLIAENGVSDVLHAYLDGLLGEKTEGTIITKFDVLHVPSTSLVDG